LHSELRHIGLPESYKPGRAEPRAERGVGGRTIVGVAQCPITHVKGLSLLHRSDVFEKEWHAPKRAVGQLGRYCGLPSFFKERDDYSNSDLRTGNASLDRRTAYLTPQILTPYYCDPQRT
jgi:hypothetical protein